MPPPLTKRSGATSETAATIAARRSRISAIDARCIRRIPKFRSALAGRRVADAGDLALVRHQPDQLDARSPGDLLGEAPSRLRGADRGALRADLQAVAERPEADVDVDRDRDDRRAAADRELDQVELRRLVHHQDGRCAGLSRLELRQPRDRLPVGRRIGDQQVTMAGLGEHQGLRDREAEDALEARRRAPRPARAPPGSAPTSRPPGSACRRRGRASRPRSRRARRDRRMRRAPRSPRRSPRIGRRARRRPRPSSVFEPLESRRARRGGRVAEGTRLLSE